MRHRGKGGVALLWHKRISKQVSHAQIDDDRIIAIDVILENNLHLIIICIYMRSSDYCIDYFREYLDKLRDMYLYFSTYSQVVIIGDLNTEIKGGRYAPVCKITSSYREMQNLLHELDVVSLKSHLKCKGPLFTWTGETCNSYVNRSMINHILISNSMLDLVSHCQVHDSHPLNTSDHRPVHASFL